VIFVTVGAQMPFDRMVRVIDKWAARGSRSDVFAQIGCTDYRPNAVGYETLLTPTVFRKMANDASLIVAHAGMGTIITALELRKPIIILPRRADLKETRNDHQIETAKRLRNMASITVAMSDEELDGILEEVCDLSGVHAGRDFVCPHFPIGCPFADPEICNEQRGASACPSLLSSVRMFIYGIPRRVGAK